MKQASKEREKQRRHVYIADEIYTKVGIEAAKNGIDKWKVIEEALKKYFSDKE